MHFVSALENIKIYIKTNIKIAATCFGLRPSSGILHMSLTTVTFIKSVKTRRYGLCGCVAASYDITNVIITKGFWVTDSPNYCIVYKIVLWEE
jgi:hypothetical protein